MIIRENIEGEYSGIEHEISADVFQSIKVITKNTSERIGKFAIDLALKLGRNQIYVVHKASIMKLSDGLFVKTVQDIPTPSSEIVFKEIPLDVLCFEVQSSFD